MAKLIDIITKELLKILAEGEKDMNQLIVKTGLNPFGISPIINNLIEEGKVSLRKVRAKKFYSLKK